MHRASRSVKAGPQMVFRADWGERIVTALHTRMPAHQAVAWTCAREVMILRKILIREMAGTQAPKRASRVLSVWRFERQAGLPDGIQMDEGFIHVG